MAAKKSFKGTNPAMQFISTAPLAAPEEETPVTAPLAKVPKAAAPIETAAPSAPIPAQFAPDQSAAPASQTPDAVTEAAPTAVPSAISNPSAAMPAAIPTRAQAEIQPIQKAAAPALEVVSAARPTSSAVSPVRPASDAEKAAKRMVEATERKTRRLNLLLQPSVLGELTKIAHMKQKSVNDLINSILKEYCSEHCDLAKRYDDIFGV